MSNIAVHMRMTGLQVTNEDVDGRKKAVLDLSTGWGKARSSTAQIMRKASEISVALHGDGSPPVALADEVQSAVQVHASAFLYSESPLEVGICAGSAILAMMDVPHNGDGWGIADWYATAIWCALSFQAPLADAKRESLRNEVMEACRSRSLKAAAVSRDRTVVADFGDFGAAQGDDAKAVSAFKKATSATIAALRRNAALDREELDFLWWSQVTRSKLLDKPFNQLSEPARLVASGIEAGRLLRRMPSDVHRDIALRGLDMNDSVDLTELLAAVGADRAELGAAYQSGTVIDLPLVFPLLAALASGVANAGGGEIKRTCADWGSRALLEASLVGLSSAGIPPL